jgi:hypothetical protein
MVGLREPTHTALNSGITDTRIVSLGTQTKHMCAERSGVEGGRARGSRWNEFGGAGVRENEHHGRALFLVAVDQFASGRFEEVTAEDAGLVDVHRALRLEYLHFAVFQTRVFADELVALHRLTPPQARSAPGSQSKRAGQCL